MIPIAIFFPVNPEADAFDLVEQANDGIKAGLKLCTNGRQFALFPRVPRGWALFGTSIKPTGEPPCAA